MTTIFLLVHVLMYASGQVYTDGPWIFKDGDVCERAQKALNQSHIPLLGTSGQPDRAGWACIRLIQP